MTIPRPCARCGETIPEGRLEALPETEVCIQCSKAMGGEFELIAVQENLAKTGSLKKNYGGVNIKKRRKTIVPKEDEAGE